MVVGRLAAVELAPGRVGGLLNPPVAVPVRVAELEVGFVAVEEVVPGRRAAVVVVVPGFFAAVVVPVLLGPVVAGFFAGAAAAEGDLGFSVEASAGESSTGPSSAGAASTGGASAGGASAGGASTGGAARVSAGASAGASSCWTTSYPSASDIVALGASNWRWQCLVEEFTSKPWQLVSATWTKAKPMRHNPLDCGQALSSQELGGAWVKLPGGGGNEVQPTI